MVQEREGGLLDVVLPYIGDIIAYRHGLHFCQEVEVEGKVEA
jgi:hypothetical protein